MKTTTLIIASIIAPFLSVAVASTKPTAPSVSKHAIEQAKATGKYILVGNAKFGDRHVAQFLDRNFVIEETSGSATTAFLVYDEEGQLVHRVVGDKKYPYELAVKIKRGLDANTQYYSLLARFESGERTTELLKNAITGASDAQDTGNAGHLMAAYLETLSSAPTAEQLHFVAKYTTKTTDPGFTILMENGAAIDKLAAIIFAEAFAPRVHDRKIDVAALTVAVKATYPTATLAQHIDEMGLELLEMREDWSGIAQLLPGYLATYEGQVTAQQADYYAGLVKK